jgi:hypothetical protein
MLASWSVSISCVSADKIGIYVEGEYVERDGVGIADATCENVGVSLDGNQLTAFMREHLIPAVAPENRNAWERLL